MKIGQMAEIFNAGACLLWGMFAIYAVAKGRVNLGSLFPVVVRSAQPRLFWGLVVAYAGVSLWCGVVAILQFTGAIVAPDLL